MDQQAFDALNFEEQCEMFHRSPYGEKAELLVRSHDPLTLAASLSSEELYLMTREIDAEERREVMKYANLPQLFFMSDIDCWQKDRVHPQGFLAWLEQLQAADEERLAAWLTQADYELLVAGFSQLIEVLKPEWEYAVDDVLGDKPYFTFDSLYYICVREENFKVVKEALELLYERDRAGYVNVVEGVLSELYDQMEEEAYQKRETRLSEHGFPAKEEARRLYRPLAQAEWETLAKKNGQAPLRAERALPHYPVVRSDNQLFFDTALTLVQEQTIRDQLYEELVWLANKVLAVQGIDVVREAEVKRGIERVRQYVNIGLECLSNKRLAPARDLLCSRWLEHIFRWGFTEVIHVREKAEALVTEFWAGDLDSCLQCVDGVYGEALRGLLQTYPTYFDATAMSETHAYRDFRDGAELAHTRDTVSAVHAVHVWLAQQFPEFFHVVTLEQGRGKQQVELSAVLITIFAHEVLGKPPSFHPLDSKAVQLFVSKGFTGEVANRHLDPTLVTQFRERYIPEALARQSEPVWQAAFQRAEEELGRLNPKTPVDPRFVHCVRIACKSMPL